MVKKRSLPLLLILLMVFSSVAQAAPLSAGQSVASQVAKAVHNYSKSISNSTEGKKYKFGDKVRVIVEVDGAPAITYATQQGKQYSELSKSVKAQLQSKILNKQQAVKNQIEQKSISMQYKQNFTTTFNGFSGVVEYGQIPAIKSIDGVTNVTIAHEIQRPEEQPDLKYSKAIVQAQEAWDNYGYKGQGMVVAIIDTGIDYTHKDMVISDPSQAALTKDKVDSLVAEKGLPGKFYTNKVPYGYNYYDENSEIRDLGPNASMHGMHVSGIVAANGDENNGGIKGVAPEAQLLAMKIFGNDPEMKSTWSDIEIKAIDDSIKLGADVVNMSLGSTGAFVQPDDPEQEAIQKAVDNGVLMSISAGNSNNIGDGYANPFATNPDKGVVGAPGLANSSIQVASLENSYIDLDAITYSVDGTVGGKAPFLSASSVDPNKQTQKKFEVLAAGIGNPSDFEGKDFHGKYALVKRGTLNFVTKTLNAQAAGAAGIIVYNNTDGFVSMATEADITIPQLFMLKSDGDNLKAQLDAGKKVEVEFQGDKTTAVNPTAGQMSSFTSWGVTPNLDFKPEITAPGGNIYSTLNNNTYGVMSGTSMAAPHVSGGSALVLERVKKDFANLTGAEKVQMAKNLLMNTSQVVIDKGSTYNKALGLNNPYSPRRQGAGLMQLNAALSTPVVVTNTATNEAKVALKEIDGNKATFTLKAQNFSDKDVTYKVNGNVQTDLALFNKDGVPVDQGEAQGIYKADGNFDPNTGVGEFPISFSQDQLTVPANGTATVDVTVDLSNNVDWAYGAPLDQIFKNGYFVEGFVSLTDVSDVNPVISVPYVGFKGDWNKAPILDDMIYDSKAVTSFYKQAGMLTHAGKDQNGNDNFDYLGYNPVDASLKSSTIAISPNGDGVNDDAMAYLSFLRNAKTVEYKIVDKDGNVLRKIKSDEYVRKNFNDGGRGLQVYLDPSTAWDGKVNNKVVQDGQYYYEIDSTLDYPGKDPQVLKVPVTVDTVAPKVSASVSGDKLTINGSDDGSGIAYYDVLVNGTSVFGEKDKPLAGNTTSYTFKETPKVGSTVDVVAYDFAGNKTDTVVDGVNDTTIPYIYVTSIGATNAYTTHELPVSGYVTDESKIREVTVNGNPVDLTWNADKKEYDFSTKVTFDSDGIYAVPISATDVAGNTISYKVRDLIIDATAPVINVDAPTNVKADVDSVDLHATISDNFDQLRYFVNGNEEFYKPSNGLYEMNGVSQDVTTHVSLEPGNNTFTLKLVDRAGNVTTKEVNIFRRAATHNVSYIYNGQTYLKVPVADGGTVTAPQVPSFPGYTFIGWYKDASFSAKYDFNAPITDDTNIYALVVPNPAAPASAKAASAGYDKVTVSWSKVAGAVGYDVYRSTSKTGTFTKVATVSGSASSYTNSGLTTGKTYYYKVVAFATVDGTKVTGSASAVVGAAPVLSAPTGLKASKVSSTSIKTSWSSVSGATGYELYRATSKTGSYTKVKSISSTSYTNSGLAKGKTYYYKVRAYRSVSGSNVYSSYSSVVSLGL